jgi:molybdate transport system substrate-binding protein
MVRHVAFCLLFAVARFALAGEVSVAVAANFTAPMREIAARFELETGHKARLSFGSSGKFFAQIQNGAPFEVFLSADDEKPARLEAVGATLPGSRFTYAVGRLVLWSADDGLIDDGPKLLRKGGFAHLAIANPALAPYGAAAVAALKALGAYDGVAGKLVQAENIAQAYQFVATGNAELGFVAMSQVMLDGKLRSGSAWPVPAELHAPIRQDAVVRARAAGNPAAAALVEYLRGDKAKTVISSFGYGL